MPPRLRKLVRHRAGGRCEYCQLPLWQMNYEERLELRAELMASGRWPKPDAQ